MGIAGHSAARSNPLVEHAEPPPSCSTFARAQNGEPVIEELLVDYLPRLRAFIRANMNPELRRRESDSDVVQSVCRVLLDGRANFDFRSEEKFRAWLFTAALNRIRHKRRFHHVGKRDIGQGDLRWRIGADSRPHAWLEWRSRDSGIERTRLSSSRALQDWLAARSPERDFIRFQVWNDSFEVYLEARQVIEAAGFRAGWKARKKDEELDLVLTSGRPPPREGPVRVD